MLHKVRSSPQWRSGCSTTKQILLDLRSIIWGLFAKAVGLFTMFIANFLKMCSIYISVELQLVVSEADFSYPSLSD